MFDNLIKALYTQAYALLKTKQMNKDNDSQALQGKHYVQTHSSLRYKPTNKANDC